jgi:hypothetical protein
MRPRTDRASRRPLAPPRTPAERFCDLLGADPAFAEAVFGDLAEEFALRAAQDGVGAARRWYAREALRSAPHFVRSGLRCANWQARARLGMWVAGSVLAAAAGVLALVLRDGPPVRLVAGTGGVGPVVVNSRLPFRMPMRVLDAAGHLLNARGVRYRWASGVPVTVTPDGVVTCARAGDAVVRASLGPLATRVPVLCRPVHAVFAAEPWMVFVVGTPAREIAFVAVDAAGRRVAPLAGVLRVRDTTVAALVATQDGPGQAGGRRIAPRAPGQTLIDAQVGDRRTDVTVTVYRPVPTLDALRPGQRLVAAPIRLASGETRRWRMAPGYYRLSVLPDLTGDARGQTPELAILGANCMRWSDQRFVCVAGPDAWVVAYHPWRAAPAPARTGYLAIEEAERVGVPARAR